MIEHAGTPAMLVLNDWHIEGGRIYGFARDANQYITAVLDRSDDDRPEQGGRVQGEGYTFVLSRPLGQLE
ncbi:hypothetical protein VAC51_00037 [Variovorax phage VAC_51]|uniref:Uncharacterized protein n=1 Tax=Variovorax phage VAC_51 TaxID=2985242 RepID=A0A9N6WSV3_9CAUD|nr:hypothetical protein VAC51_00037 [Variovorax phage VAC_51]